MLISLALSGPLHAELLAHLTTSAGPITVELQYQKAPQAVANFITLAEGTRARIHPTSGAVMRAPMYVGEKFFRVLNDPGFKIAQTGSGTGTNGGGPGFTFKDEFDPTLTHTPYVLSMANSGPNTNGSQIFFTGNVSIPGLDNVHTVFGLVKDSASHLAIDAIHAAGDNGSTITGISFTRTDSAALAFNEHAQGLPLITQPAGNLSVNRGVAATWNFSQAIGPGTVLRAFRSYNLSDWSDLQNGGTLHVGIGSPEAQPAYSSITLDDAQAPKAFYNLSVAQHPGSVSPSNLNGHTVGIATGKEVLYYDFYQNGSGGVMYRSLSGDPPYEQYLFQTLSFQSGAHDFTLQVQHTNFTPQALLIKIGCDSANSELTEISGRNSTSSFQGDWLPYGSGDALIWREF